MKLLEVKGKEYQLRLTTKACVKCEQRLGKNPLNVFLEASDNKMPKINDLMVILHECLNTCNHGIKIDDVYDLYDDYCEEGNSITDLIELLIDVFKDAGFIPEDTKNQ